MESLCNYLGVLHVVLRAYWQGDGRPEGLLKAIDLVPTVALLRSQRHPWMVEGVHQYAFCYQAVMQLLEVAAKRISTS